MLRVKIEDKMQWQIQEGKKEGVNHLQGFGTRNCQKRGGEGSLIFTYSPHYIFLSCTFTDYHFCDN